MLPLKDEAPAPAVEKKPKAVAKALSVKIGQPAPGAKLPRMAVVIVTADVSEVASAKLLVNGEEVASLRQAPFVFSFQMGKAMGERKIEVVAKTADGQTASDSVTTEASLR